MKYYWKQKDKVIEVEQKIIISLAFDLDIELPYPWIFSYVEYMKADQLITQWAWSFCNDSHRSLVSLMFPPRNNSSIINFVINSKFIVILL